MTSALPAFVDTTATRLALHHLAEQVLAAEQKAVNGDFRLEALPDGFATRWFSGADQVRRRVRVRNGVLVREIGSDTVAAPITGDFDPAAANVLYAWWDLGTRVLESVAQSYGPKSSDVVLYPEHFDVGSIVDLGEPGKVNLGFSPGDDFCPEPYVYAGPWEKQDGEFWNAPFGAYRRYTQIDLAAAGEDTRAFLDEVIDRLRSTTTSTKTSRSE